MIADSLVICVGDLLHIYIYKFVQGRWSGGDEFNFLQKLL